MTYVIGTVFDGVAAIIADMRVTYSRGEGANNALKIGFFFPGCIFGMSGSERGLRAFVQYIKRELTGQNSLEGFWSDFQLAVSEYDFTHLNEAFELIISSRHSGCPELYLLRAPEGVLQKAATRTITTGKGQAFLDDDLTRFEKLEFASTWPSERTKALPEEYFAYSYCLWLTERTRGDDAVRLEDEAAVGGVFHYAWQNGFTEGAQSPALYLLADPSHHPIDVHSFRVSHREGAIVVEDSVTGNFVGYSDIVVPRWGELSSDEVAAELQRIAESDSASQRYVFCGIGNPHSSSRSSLARLYAETADDCLPAFGPDFAMHPRAQEVFQTLAAMRHAFESGVGARRGGPGVYRQISGSSSAVSLDDLARFEGCPGFSAHLCFLAPDPLTGNERDRILLEASNGGQSESVRLFLDANGLICLRYAFDGGGSAAIRMPAPPADVVSKLHFGIAGRDAELLLFMISENEHVVHVIRNQQTNSVDGTLPVVLGCDRQRLAGCEFSIFEIAICGSIPSLGQMRQVDTAYAQHQVGRSQAIPVGPSNPLYSGERPRNG